MLFYDWSVNVNLLLNSQAQSLYIWVIDQVSGQDGWILAKFFFCACLWTEKKSRSIKLAKNE